MKLVLDLDTEGYEALNEKPGVALISDVWEAIRESGLDTFITIEEG